MRTQGEAISTKIKDSILEIERLIGISHDEEDFAKLIKILGGEIEKFLKSIVYQGQLNSNFYDLINDLLNLGITIDSVQFLQNFRLAYNGYKHNPSYSINVNSARNLFIELDKGINEIQDKGLGNVNLAYNRKSKHLVWFSGWEDYIGGMVECDIFIPDYSIDFPMGMEHFNLSFDGWDEVIQKYTSSGELKFGKEYISERAYNVWKAQSDFINAGSFQGNLSEFVRDLASHTAEREKDLIPFLKRENDAYSVKAAIVFSLQDSLIQNHWRDKNDLKDEIILRSSYDYGINLESNYLTNYINEIDFDIIIQNRDRLKMTDEILWVDEKSFNSPDNLVFSQDLNIGQNSNNKILTRIK
ncbi:hypothetical protein [uncultured Aquimarina sp.]|uniref:hypothetical protein n=1 Tax=uncultured Aquimarina sp. TaxID=575652 RepID=UPI0026158282|nr:hypothetical protein [uncultured Aquimarina sp.]